MTLPSHRMVINQYFCSTCGPFPDTEPGKGEGPTLNIESLNIDLSAPKKKRQRFVFTVKHFYLGGSGSDARRDFASSYRPISFFLTQIYPVDTHVTIRFECKRTGLFSLLFFEGGKFYPL